MKTILCYGDSNTYGFNPRTGLRYDQHTRWPGHLADVLGEDYRVVEEGCNGRTTIFDDPIEGWKNGLNYLKPCLNSHKPVDIVIMMLGTNDLKRTFQASVEEIAAGVQALLDVLISFPKEKQGFTPKIILIAPPEIGADMSNSPFDRSFDETAITRSKEFARVYKELADKNRCIYFNAAEVVTASKVDSLHLDPESHVALADALAEIVKKNS